MDFREFVNQTEKPGKSWEASKTEILQMWRTLRPYMPINVTPVPSHHRGNRYDHDGIRINGTSSFISSILSRLKDFLQYEARGNLELDVEYRQIENRGNEIQNAEKYVCYIHVIEAKPKKLKLPKVKRPEI